ncbi:DEAD-domain-containing protein [Pisolithus microcarpus]|nr:DEAD-domain-containing protein [Pisolithus microcarpus]
MPTPEEASTSTAPEKSFRELGLIEPLLEALEKVKFKSPTEIQSQVLPHALQGRDIIGEPKGLFAVVLAPTRELAYQISQQFESLGAAMGVRCLVLIGGVDKMPQAVALAKRPHIIVATPGRLNDHLQSTKGFSLRNIKFLVMDEADRLLDMDFGAEIDQILKVIPKERTTYLFSATMTTKVAKLQRASLSNPVRVEVSSKYQTVSTLLQYYLFVPLIHKDVHLIYLANELASNSIIIFTRTVHDAQRLSIMLRTLGFPAEVRKILVATDSCELGVWICHPVDVVINFDVPTHSKDYIHRVGRTARAGRAGKSITILLQRIEKVIEKKLDMWPVSKEEVMLLKQRVDEAGRMAINELKEHTKGEGKKRRREEGRSKDDRDRDDDVVEAGMPEIKKSKSRR